MFNSRNLGALIVDEKPHVKSWDEPQYSIQNLAIEESYGFGVLNEGQAIAVPRVRPTFTGCSTLQALDHPVRPDSAVLDAFEGLSPATSAQTSLTSGSLLLRSREVDTAGARSSRRV